MRWIVLTFFASMLWILTTSAVAVDESALRQSNNQVERALRDLQQGDLPAAKRHIDRALKAFPHHPGAHLLLGHLAMSEENYASALEHYDHAADGYGLLIRDSIRARNTKYNYDFGDPLIVGQSGDVTHFGDWTALKIDFDFRTHGLNMSGTDVAPLTDEPEVPAHVDLFRGRALLGLGRHEEAIEVWKKIADELPIAHTHLAAGYMLLGRPKDAAVELSRAEAAGIKVSDELREWVESALPPP